MEKNGALGVVTKPDGRALKREARGTPMDQRVREGDGKGSPQQLKANVGTYVNTLHSNNN